MRLLVFWESQRIARKGVRAIDARNSQLENDSNAAKTSVGAPGLSTLVAHDCGYPLSRYTCRATRVATNFLDFIAFSMCSTGVALHPLKILVSHLPPLPVP